MKNRIMKSLCFAHYSLRLDWCAYICLISGMLWGTCLRGHIGESVRMSLGHNNRKCSGVCGGIPTGSVLVFMGHIDRKCSGVCGGIPTGSVLVFVGHTDRKCSGVCGAYRQEAF
jgi:hypothetical protein